MNKRILVTGGAGFVGSHLVKKLLSEGHEVVCLDDFSTGQKNNITECLNNPKFHLLEQNVCDPVSIEVHEIYNLACPASPVAYQAEPIATLKTSILGTLNMLELAKKTKAKMLQASTSEVYGDPEVHPQTENYWGHVNPVGLRSCYDEGKRAAETLCMDFHRQYGVDVKIIRIFNTYGPNMSPEDGRVVSNFIVQALKNEPLTIYGDGTQTRSFQYVTDLVNGMVATMNTEKGFTGPANIGNPGEFTILEFANLVKKLIPESTSKIIHKELPSDDPKQRRPDITLAKDKLRWEPKVKLEQGLELTINYFRDYLSTEHK